MPTVEAVRQLMVPAKGRNGSIIVEVGKKVDVPEDVADRLVELGAAKKARGKAEVSASSDE